jgi:hypothetical protein
MGLYGMDWMDLVQDMDQWRFGFYKMFGSSRVASKLAAFPEGFSSVELIIFSLHDSWELVQYQDGPRFIQLAAAR